MKTFIINRWDALRNSFWFVPSVLSLGALLLAVLGPVVDAHIGPWILRQIPWLGIPATAARTVLSAIGGAMVSVAGIVFSIMIVALSITTSQYGSRLFRTFMSDLMTQLALGTMLATSLYCLLALATVHDRDQTAAAELSVILGVMLSVFSLAVLIYFIHHVATLIQAPNVVAAVASDMNSAILRLFPETLGESADDGFVPDALAAQIAQLGNNFLSVDADKEGYLQAIDEEGLLEFASEQDVVVALEVQPGSFICRGQCVARVWGCGESEEKVRHFLNARFFVGNRRTPRQDACCAIEELVEVAVRALSPGINDPFTAVTCIHHLGASLSRLANRKIPSALRRDSEGQLRVMAHPTTFVDALNIAFTQIRQYGSSNVVVASYMLDALSRIARSASRAQDRDAIFRQAAALRHDFERQVTEPSDVDNFRQEFERMLAEAQAAEANDWMAHSS